MGLGGYMARNKQSDFEMQFILAEEKSYLQKVHNYIDDVVQKAEDDYLKVKSDYKFEYAGSTEERKEAQYVIRQAYTAKEETKNILIQKESPYFARMDFNIISNRHIDKEHVYIGKTSIGDSRKMYVYDWRTPVGERYYIKDAISFKHENYEYQLLLRRGITIKNEELQSVHNEYVKGRSSYEDDIFDPFLLNILREKRNKKGLTDIIKTIQHNQYAIIRQPLNQSLIVQGCAGSGKTMILLHRLSYLLYNNKQMRVEDIKIITPNELFNNHINHLAQILDIDSIDRLTLEAYYLDKLNAYQLNLGKNSLKKLAPEHTSQDRVFYSDEYLLSLQDYYLNWYSALQALVEEKSIVILCNQVINKHSWKAPLHQESLQNLYTLIKETLKEHTENASKYALMKYQKEKLQDEIKQIYVLLEECIHEVDFIEEERVQKKVLIDEMALKIEKEYLVARPSNEELLNQQNELQKVLITKQVNMAKLISLPESLELYIELKKSQLMNELTTKRNILALKVRFGQSASLVEEQELSSLQRKFESMYEPEKIVSYMDELNKLLKVKEALLADIEYLKYQHEQISILLDTSENDEMSSNHEEYQHYVNELNVLNEKLRVSQLKCSDLENRCVELKKRDLEYTEALLEIQAKLLNDHEIQELESVSNILPTNMLFLLNKIYIPFREAFEKITNGKLTRPLYKYDLFALLHLCIWHKGTLHKKDRYLYIDEGQDLCRNEYQLIQLLNNHKVVFNVYGDMNQDISHVNPSWNWSELKQLTSSTYFELNENYRNTVEITNYCNQTLDMKVLPIGITGPAVKEVKLDAWLKKLVSKSNEQSNLKSYKMIVKNEESTIVSQLNALLGASKINTIFQNGDLLQENKLNIFSVPMVKGLEFDQVIVCTENMCPNEKYIGFTRALNKLIVSID